MIGSLTNDVFERRASVGSGPFLLFGRVFFKQILEKIVSLRIKTHSNINLVASRHIKREKGSRPVVVRRSQSKTSLLN